MRAAGGDPQFVVTTTMMAAYTAMHSGAHGVIFVGGPENHGALVKDIDRHEKSQPGERSGYA